MKRLGPVALVGGRGYIGRALASDLSRSRVPFWIVGRQSAAPAREIPPGGGYRSCGHSLDKAVAGASVVVHLASVTTPALGAASPMLDIDNIRFTLSLINSCLRQGVSQLIFPSSGGTVYGVLEGAANEDFPVNPVCSHGLGKLASEHYLRIYSLGSPLKTTVLRISNCYGGAQVTKGGQGVVSYLADAISAGRKVALFGDTVRDYVHIDDVVLAFRLAMEKPEPHRVLNISTGVGTRLTELAKVVAGLLGRKAKLEVGGLRPCDVPMSVLDNARARSVLGWSPRWELRAGLEDYLKSRKA